jgi:hypothetical protein
MADYYPLIVKAVAGLEKSTGETRRALYDRARTALLAQLRGVEPALNDAEITRERLALEEAIRKVEAEVAFQRAPDTRRLREQPPRPEPVEDQAQAQAQEFADTPIAYAPRAVRSAMGMDDGDGTEVEETRPAVPLSAAATARLPDGDMRRGERWTPGGSSPSDGGLRSFRENISEAGAEEGGIRAYPAADREFRRFEQSPGQWEHGDAGQELEHAHPLSRLSPREAPRPPAVVAGQDDGRGRALQTFPRVVRPDRAQGAERVAPQRVAPSWSAPRNINRIVAIAVIALLTLGIAGAAYWFAEDIFTTIARNPARPADPAAAVDGRGKISERAPVMGGADNAAPQKVVLYEEDPSNPNGTKFAGAAIWRTEPVPAVQPGQKPDVAIIGEIQIPDQKVSVRLKIRRNDDKQLPASHTVEIQFTLPPNFSHGGIQSIPGIMVKQGETTRGTALFGVAVKVMDNYFLVGLSQAEGEMQSNVRLLKERSWFDVPIFYADNKRAIVAIEKGPPGERAFSEAFAAWEQ